MKTSKNSFSIPKLCSVSLIFILLFNSTLSATDIKFNKFNITNYWALSYGLAVIVSFSNAAWLAAPVRGAITIKNSSQSTVFQETVTTSTIQPYQNGTLTTTLHFTPTITGEYTISIHLEPVGMGDIDPTNNDGQMTLTVFEPPAGKLIFNNQGITISQLDFTFANAGQTNSSYGLLAVDFAQISSASGYSSGWLNVSTGANWIVQNMPFDNSTGIPGLSTMFNLNSIVNVSEIDIWANASQSPLTSFPATPVMTLPVGNVQYNAQGRNMPIGTIPAPIPFETIPFTPRGRSELAWQHGHPSIEQDENQCAPSAVANSLQWLEIEKGIIVPHNHQQGIRDNSLVGELDKAMQRQPHQATSDPDILSGKIKYVNDNNLKDHLSLKHKNRVGQEFISNNNVTVGNVTSEANNNAATSLIDWIIEELKHGEDVELIIGWDGGGGHVVDLIGGGYTKGVPWLAWVHDADQAYNDNGTPANTADDAVNANGGITPQAGGYGWSYIIDQKLASVVGGSTSKGTIDFALSESKKDPVSIDLKNKELPLNFTLHHNFPNPFNPSTSISYALPQRAFVELKVFSLNGEIIKTIVSETQNPGVYKVTFNASGMASGVYFYSLKAGKYMQTKKMILLK